MRKHLTRCPAVSRHHSLYSREVVKDNIPNAWPIVYTEEVCYFCSCILWWSIYLFHRHGFLPLVPLERSITANQYKRSSDWSPVILRWSISIFLTRALSSRMTPPPSTRSTRAHWMFRRGGTFQKSYARAFTDSRSQPRDSGAPSFDSALLRQRPLWPLPKKTEGITLGRTVYITPVESVTRLASCAEI